MEIVVNGERYCVLESVPAGNEYAEPALERVGGDPPFVWRAGLLAARDYRRLDTLAAVAWDSSDVRSGRADGRARQIARTHSPGRSPANDPGPRQREGNAGFRSKPAIKWNSCRSPGPNTGCSMTPAIRLAPPACRSVGAAARMLTLRSAITRFCLSAVIVCRRDVASVGVRFV
jgi:hypothetical protein